MVNHGKRSDRDNAGDSLALIVNGDGKVTNRYLYGALVDEVLDEETLAYDANNNVTSGVLWALSDHQGSVRDWAKFGTEVSVVKHVDYDPFGNVIAQTPTDAAIATMFGYTGRSTDPLTKLQDNRARAYDPTLGRFISQDPIGFAAGDANLYRMVGNHPSYATDPSGLETIDGHSVTRLGHHIVPHELWSLFGFDPSVTTIFDRTENRIGQEFADNKDTRHNFFRHGDSGYTGHVKVELHQELKKFMQVNKIKDGKLTIPQQERFAEDFVNHIKHRRQNEFIRGFNQAVKDGGKVELKKWAAEVGDDLPKPKSIEKLTVIKGVAKLKGLKSVGRFITKNVSRYVLSPMFAMWAYNEARANGASPIESAGLAAYEIYAPPGMSKSDLDAMEKRYRETVENAAMAGRGIGDPEKFSSTILGSGFINGRKMLYDEYRSMQLVDEEGKNVGGTRNSWDREE